jgi:hypothetical protein
MRITDAAERLGLALAASAGLWLLGQGMVDLFQISLTEQAVSEMERGRLRVGCAVALSSAVAWIAVRRGFAPGAAVAVALPVVLAAPLMLMAEETLLPQLAVLLTLPVGIGGVLGLLVVRSRGRAPAAPSRP